MPPTPLSAASSASALAVLLLAGTLSAPTARAAEKFAISADVGATGRFIDNLALSDLEGFGMNLGARAEMNVMLQLKTDIRYMEGALFSPDEDRYFDLSLSGSSPALLIFALDVHEMYWRTSTRAGDELFYVNGGLGMKGKLGGTFKGSLGVSYLTASNTMADANETALGVYAGLEHMFRSGPVDTNIRAAWFVAANQAQPYMGMLVDGDLTVKFPVGKVFLGPRLDIAYRNLGLNRAAGDLFGQQQEMSAHLGLALHWGTGHGDD